MWKDVTDDCKDYLKEHEDSADELRLMYNTLNSSLRRNKYIAEKKTEVWESIKAIDPEIYMKIKPLLDEANMRKQVKFWDQ